MAFDKGSLRAHHLALISMIVGFLAGYDSGVAGGILTFKSFQSSFGYSGTAATNRVNALTVGLQILGCFLSCFFAGMVTERFGRRWAVWIFSSVFIVGVILQTAPTNNLGAWYFARLISGVGQGGLSVAVPIFTAEMAPPRIRGRLGSFYQWMFTLGIFTAYWINYGMPRNFPGTEARQWQIPVSLQMVSASFLWLGMFTVPESVRWLLKKNRNEEAWKSLVWVRADSGPIVEIEFNEIKEGLKMEQEVGSEIRRTELLLGENRGRLISGSLAFLFQQGTGGSALAYFSPQFFQQLVGKGERDLLLTGLFGAIKLVACSIFIVFLASRVGRRVPLIVGAFGMFACLFPVAVILRTTPKLPDDAESLPVSSTSIATIALVFLDVFIYNCSFGPIPWVYVAEIFPNRLRERGVAICLTIHWLFNFVFTFSTPYMLSGTGTRGWGTFLFYAIFDIVMGVWAILFMKETKNKTLERLNQEIDSDTRILTNKDEAEEANSVAGLGQGYSKRTASNSDGARDLPKEI